MKLLPHLLSLVFAFPLLAADAVALVKAHGALLFVDEFNRTEKTPGKEDIGAGRTANSGWRAKGNQQVFLRDGALQVVKHAEADHGVAIFHAVAFQDGAVQMRFKLGAGDDLGLDFVDRELQTVHADHLCMARVTLKGVTMTDSRTGGMDLKIQERCKAGDESPELAKLLKTKATSFPLELKSDDWHTMLIVVAVDAMRAPVDGKRVGRFKSEGIAHPTKRMITLAVNKSAWVDDLRVWQLK